MTDREDQPVGNKYQAFIALWLGSDTLALCHQHIYDAIFTARCTTVQSVVLLSHVVCPSVCLSICLWHWWIMTT